MNFEVHEENIKLSYADYDKQTKQLEEEITALLQHMKTTSGAFTKEERAWDDANLLIDEISKTRHSLGVILDNVIDLANSLDREAWLENGVDIDARIIEHG